MQKSLAILGGMGSLATANFMTLVVSHTEAAIDDDHLRIYVDCHPQIPPRLAALEGNGEDPTPAIIRSIKKLESIGADIIVMPCVTAHGFYDSFVSAATVPFLNLPDIVVDACAHDYPMERAGLLSTAATRDFGILSKPLDRYNVPYLLTNDDEQDILAKLIAGVKANADIAAMVKDFTAVLDPMKERGADYFVLGCTELPLIANHMAVGKYRFLDPTYELAKASILACGGTFKP